MSGGTDRGESTGWLSDAGGRRQACEEGKVKVVVVFFLCNGWILDPSSSSPPPSIDGLARS
ncbi:hypothetical protein B0T13DRAFT_510748 [Neurospora crassa]|nr:hypothetical protein B0T13DRAFT_510748 [Neurospora crassa]